MPSKIFRQNLARFKYYPYLCSKLSYQRIDNMNNIESNRSTTIGGACSEGLKKGEIVMYQPDETIRLEVRVLLDNYINVDTLTMLSNRSANVSATIYTRQLSQQQQLDVQRHNQQYPPIAVNYCQHNHDRFLIIDDVVYLFGASLKDAGKKLFAYIKMQETTASELLRNIR